MSASERLRALDVAAKHGGARGDRARFTLRQATPLIADVVEAAEAYRRIQFTKPPAEVQHAGGKLDRSLTALREHLEGCDDRARLARGRELPLQVEGGDVT